MSFSLNANEISEQDSDADGLSDQYEVILGTERYLADTDGDGIDDAIEIGNDPNSPLDTDNDSIIDALDFDDDNDGLPTILENKTLKYSDIDGDGLKNHLDPDSDNDGVLDGIEAGLLNKDTNYDGVDDAFDVSHTGGVDSNGDGIRDNLKLPDHNKNGVFDYLDSNVTNHAITKPTSKSSQNITPIILENIPEKTSSLKEEIPIKLIINRYTDTDNDGLLDSQELMLGTNPLKRDTDGDTVSDAIEIGLDINSPQDSDHDGEIDALDIDDDNDGIITKLEDLNKDGSPINDDSDDDGVPNYLDGNDDGDDHLTLVEGGTKDSDNDGVLDYLDKNDARNNTHTIIVKTSKEEKLADQPELVVLFDGYEDPNTEEESFINLKEASEEMPKSISDEGNLEKKHKTWRTSQQIKVSQDKSSGIVAWVKSLF